jgi:hypothetical protein
VGAQFGVTFYKPDPELGFKFHLGMESELRFLNKNILEKEKTRTQDTGPWVANGSSSRLNFRK